MTAAAVGERQMFAVQTKRMERIDLLPLPWERAGVRVARGYRTPIISDRDGPLFFLDSERRESTRVGFGFLLLIELLPGPLDPDVVREEAEEERIEEDCFRYF